MSTSHDRISPRRALLSVSDKSGLEPLCHALVDIGCEIVSTGGTARAIRAMGIEVVDVETVTGFPEMMDGRLKTLHPRVHGGLLARRDTPEHMDAAAEHGIGMIDLLCVNLYPFEATVAKEGVTRAEAIEQIDIGGPAMVRAASKNHDAVAVVTDPSQYARVIEQIGSGGTTLALRRELAASAFVRTSAYDAAISAYLLSENRPAAAFPAVLGPRYEKLGELRYGENPHQPAALYKDPGFVGATVVGAEQLHGKPLSYNNINDAAAAFALARSLASASGKIGSAVIKHTNPCGAATHADVRTSVDLAMRGDEMAAFGGILATTGTVDLVTAERLCAEGVFIEVVVAPAFDDDALVRLRDRWANLRILATGSVGVTPAADLRPVEGGLLVQETDTGVSDRERWEHKAGPKPTAGQLDAVAVLEPVCRALSSNAVLIGGPAEGGVMLFGAGAGQMDRVASCRLAVEKAGARAKGAVAVSDAFFPFDDGPTILADAGVALIAHPGGSKRDADTFTLCDGRGIACITTGVRHFRH